LGPLQFLGLRDLGLPSSLKNPSSCTDAVNVCQGFPNCR
jgi:hypothetical protein